MSPLHPRFRRGNIVGLGYDVLVIRIVYARDHCASEQRGKLVTGGGAPEPSFDHFLLLPIA